MFMSGVWILWSKKKILFFKNENGNTFTLLIIFIVKSLQKEKNSTNLLLWSPICRNKPASTQSDSTPWKLTLGWTEEFVIQSPSNIQWTWRFQKGFGLFMKHASEVRPLICLAFHFFQDCDTQKTSPCWPRADPSPFLAQVLGMYSYHKI